MNSYCLKCKTHTSTQNMKAVVLKNGRPAQSGVCSVCHKKKMTFTRGGDLQNTLDKLPGFPWAKYPGEKHLPGHNYCGPGTRLDIRLDENDKPKRGEGPTSRADQACYKHDLAYKNYQGTRDRQKADIDLIHDLSSIDNPSLSERGSRALINNAMKAKIAVGGTILLSRK